MRGGVSLSCSFGGVVHPGMNAITAKIKTVRRIRFFMVLEDYVPDHYLALERLLEWYERERVVR
jgi:hypothetical protein